MRHMNARAFWNESEITDPNYRDQYGRDFDFEHEFDSPDFIEKDLDYLEHFAYTFADDNLWYEYYGPEDRSLFKFNPNSEITVLGSSKPEDRPNLMIGDFYITWYKRVGRCMTQNKDLTLEQWRELFNPIIMEYYSNALDSARGGNFCHGSAKELTKLIEKSPYLNEELKKLISLLK